MSDQNSQADFEIVDGKVVPVDKSANAETSSSTGRGDATVEFVEPAPVEYRTDEQVAQDAEPVEANAPDPNPDNADADAAASEAGLAEADFQVVDGEVTPVESADPGNSPPENWTEPVSEDEQAEVRSLLQVDDTEEE